MTTVCYFCFFSLLSFIYYLYSQNFPSSFHPYFLSFDTFPFPFISFASPFRLRRVAITFAKAKFLLLYRTNSWCLLPNISEKFKYYIKIFWYGRVIILVSEDLLVEVHEGKKK